MFYENKKSVIGFLQKSAKMLSSEELHLIAVHPVCCAISNRQNSKMKVIILAYGPKKDK